MLLKLIACGQREVNMKFFSSENLTAEFDEWTVKHQTWRATNYLQTDLGGDDVNWVIAIKSPGLFGRIFPVNNLKSDKPGRFRADVDEIGTGSGKVYASGRGLDR